MEDDVITLSYDDEFAPPPPPVTVTTSEPSDDDEVAPPPPPFTVTNSALEDQDEEILSPFWEEESGTIDDLNLVPDDLNDPIIQEFYRSFLGENDTTVDLRPTTPSSLPPPRSPSSVDWENENFRPPTPPRRRGVGEIEVTNRQYQFLGMHCYEQNCRVRILVPGKQTTQALHDAIPPATCQTTEEATAWQFGSPPRQNHHSALPVTPERGWLEKSKTDSHHDHQGPKATRCEPPLLSPPTIFSDDNLTFDQLPLEVRQEILQREEVRTERRPRFIHEIRGRLYRVTVKRDGSIIEKRT